MRSAFDRARARREVVETGDPSSRIYCHTMATTEAVYGTVNGGQWAVVSDLDDMHFSGQSALGQHRCYLIPIDRVHNQHHVDGSRLEPIG